MDRKITLTVELTVPEALSDEEARKYVLRAIKTSKAEYVSDNRIFLLNERKMHVRLPEPNSDHP